jgi:PAS domain S-box-containing protein
MGGIAMTAASDGGHAVEFIGDAVVCIDSAHRITLFNDVAESMFGYAAGDVLGKTLDILLPQMALARHARLVSEFAQGERGCVRMGDREPVAGRRRCGSEFPARATISRVHVGGDDIYTAIIQDLSAPGRR